MLLAQGAIDEVRLERGGHSQKHGQRSNRNVSQANHVMTMLQTWRILWTCALAPRWFPPQNAVIFAVILPGNCWIKA
jgi:hypothetical protein